jgi:hypothetical protein
MSSYLTQVPLYIHPCCAIKQYYSYQKLQIIAAGRIALVSHVLDVTDTWLRGQLNYGCLWFSSATPGKDLTVP